MNQLLLENFDLAILAVLTVAERVWPRRPVQASPHWWGRLAAWRGLNILTYHYLDAGLRLAGGPLSYHFLELGAALPPAAGLGLAFFSGTFFQYWSHRLRHVNPFWRLCHQVHHCPARFEALLELYKHPFDSLFLNAAFFFSTVTLFGLLPWQSRAVMTGFIALSTYQHANLRIGPSWIGYILYRPEQHRLHHQEGVHRWNYGIIPLWDLVFGTFRNPSTETMTVGLGAQAEQSYWRQLFCLDLSR